MSGALPEPVVITGMGAVSCLGLELQDTWAKIVEGRSGIDYISAFDPSAFRTRIAGEVRGLRPVGEAKELKIMDKHSHMAVAATRMALKDAGLGEDSVEPSRLGIFMGIGMVDYEIEYVLECAGASLGEETLWDLRKFGADAYRLLFPLRSLQLLGNITLCQIAKMYNVQGPNMVLSPFGESGAQAIGEARNVLGRGEADVVLAGGASLKVNPAALARFSISKTLSTRNDPPQKASRPFDGERDGVVLGEGAGMLVLERRSHAVERGARIHGELAGYGNAQSYESSSSSQCIASAALAMQKALMDGQLLPDDVHYINADGVSTRQGDMVETAAIKQVFGCDTRIPVSSTKSMMGHLLGGAAPVELSICLMAMEKGVIPPTINYEHPEAGCDLDYVPNVAREGAVQVALSNAAGFAGQYVSLVVKSGVGG